MEQQEKQLDLDFFKRKSQKKVNGHSPKFLMFYLSDVFFTFIICSFFILALGSAENERMSPEFSQYSTQPSTVQEIQNIEVNNNLDIQITQEIDAERLRQQVIEINNAQTTDEILNKSFEEFSLELAKTLKEKESLIPQIEKQE